MKLVNVRKGQFVYYQNQLHKVYSVKTFFKRSIHLIRLQDFEQQLSTAKDIDFYKPKHLDSFVYTHKRYTLDKNVKAKVGDYILVINPKPDSMDHHYLNAIEIVSSVERNGVISNQSNGIRHDEYWVMVPGLEEGATIIDFQNPDSEMIENQESQQAETDLPETYIPKIGDVYQRNDSDPVMQAMVVSIKGQNVYLGGNLEVKMNILTDNEKWSYVKNVKD
ncbi:MULTISPECIES: hypothetical protein [Sporosarcina]|uniref:Uncharacterized protein n=1 Tax=Sporosarcina newyorkensis TaxID=759851 RepID=A0A1T4YKB7_9BACL|nr:MULTISPECIES: hypothetical protein [Sporosarcina]MBY0221085.1 hypothetical protein [Sporosarcina aquimarina]SKB01701.1 hypothetical protein SAMN04244570_2792 [Sporosarcina newyorkensis]